MGRHADAALPARDAPPECVAAAWGVRDGPYFPGGLARRPLPRSAAVGEMGCLHGQSPVLGLPGMIEIRARCRFACASAYAGGGD